MTRHSPPDSEALKQVETRLYNRMLKNAFVGFLKSATIGAAIGLLCGMIAAVIPGLSIASGVVATGLKAAAWFGGVSGSFGAVAAIQSTRDTRRYFLLHENGRHVLQEDRSHPLVVQPEFPQPEKDSGLSQPGHAQKILAQQEQAAQSSTLKI